MKKYFYSNGHEKDGPVTLEDLKQKDIKPKTLIWHEGLDDWKEAETIDELREIFELSLPPIPKLNSKTNIRKIETFTLKKSTKKVKNQNKSFFSSIYFYVLVRIIFPPVIYIDLHYSKKMNYFLRSLFCLLLIPFALIYALLFDSLFFLFKNSVIESRHFDGTTTAIVLAYAILFSLWYLIKGIHAEIKNMDIKDFNQELITLDIENPSIVNKLLGTPQYSKFADNKFSLFDVIAKFSSQKYLNERVTRTYTYGNNYICQIEILKVQNCNKILKLPIHAICLFTQEDLKIKLNMLVIPIRRNNKLPLNKINEQILNEVIIFTNPKNTFDDEFEFLNN